MRDILAIILGGGEGKRLYPLTKYRSKPAVPIAGKYRLIDVPVSNCMHSGIERIFILTQFNSASLNRHINLSYKFDAFREGFVDILAAEQTMDNLDWFQGTADAVRKTFRHFQRFNTSDYLILAGDHIYQMDYRLMLETHRRSGADVTVAASPIPHEEARLLGILRVNDDGRIEEFLEQPAPGTDFSPFEIGADFRKKRKLRDSRKSLLASMGVYLFRHEALKSALQDYEKNDFGRHIIPAAIKEMRTQAHIFDGYWRDVGTIDSFFEANMDLLAPQPRFQLFSETNRVFTHSRFLPGSQLSGISAESSMICEGCRIEKATLKHALIGVRTIIGAGARIEKSYIMGADYYEGNSEGSTRKSDFDDPPIGIGPECQIFGAIVDKNARIGRGVKITPKQPEEKYAGIGYMVRDGITVIEKDAVIPDGAII